MLKKIILNTTCLMSVLAQAGHPIDEIGADGRTVLTRAIMNKAPDSLSEIIEAIKAGADVNRPDGFGKKPLELLADQCDEHEDDYSDGDVGEEGDLDSESEDSDSGSETLSVEDDNLATEGIDPEDQGLCIYNKKVLLLLRTKKLDLDSYKKAVEILTQLDRCGSGFFLNKIINEMASCERIVLGERKELMNLIFKFAVETNDNSIIKKYLEFNFVNAEQIALTAYHLTDRKASSSFDVPIFLSDFERILSCRAKQNDQDGLLDEIFTLLPEGLKQIAFFIVQRPDLSIEQLEEEIDSYTQSVLDILRHGNGEDWAKIEEQPLDYLCL